MIRIVKQPPPSHYFNLVRNPGRAFIKRHPNPTANEFARHSFWREIHDYLYQINNGICAYCSSWTPRSSLSSDDHTSVDHFIPKSFAPYLAYEWSNYRLCRARINQRKGNSLKIIDPFQVVNGWFQIDFTTFQIIAGDAVSIYVKNRIDTTINILDLNDTIYIDERVEVIRQYCLSKVTITDLKLLYPFIASEIIRTEFDVYYRQTMASYFVKNGN